jgi:hypothetical protein
MPTTTAYAIGGFPSDRAVVSTFGARTTSGERGDLLVDIFPAFDDDKFTDALALSDKDPPFNDTDPPLMDSSIKLFTDPFLKDEVVSDDSAKREDECWC